MNDAVAGNGDGDGIRAAGAGDGTRRFGRADGARDVLVACRAAWRHASQGTPYLSLEVGSLHVERKGWVLPWCRDVPHRSPKPRERGISW